MRPAVSEQWSLGMTAYEGKPSQWLRLDEAVFSLFGRRGLDVFTLAFGRDALPAELACSLSHKTLSRSPAAWRALATRIKVVLSGK